MLDVDKLEYRYPEARIHADFRLEEGAALALMGPSGCGKSTVLNLIAGFLEPLSGDIRFQGRSLTGLTPSERPLTQLFQAHNLFPHLPVWQNLGLGIDPGLKLGEIDRRRISAVLDDVGLDGYEQRMPNQLSGGQQQRVALARCLLRNRPLLLLDEPFSALDAALRDEMIDLVRHIHNRQSLTLLLTTHRQEDAVALNAAIYQMEKLPAPEVS